MCSSDLCKAVCTKLMKSESDWVNDMLCEMREGPLDCIRAGEVTKALFGKDEKT